MTNLPTYTLIKQGAEARIFSTNIYGKDMIVKERFSKKYRHPQLDKSLSNQRMKAEIRSMIKCRSLGIKTPAIFMSDINTNKIYMEKINAVTLREHIDYVQENFEIDWFDRLCNIACSLAKIVSTLHDNGIIHGDLTTSNVMINNLENNLKCDLFLIDFGLSSSDSVPEDMAVDLYVLERAMISTHINTEKLFEYLLNEYSNIASVGKEVIKKLNEVRLRGRKRTMVG